jgi:hypothetical protein
MSNPTGRPSNITFGITDAKEDKIIALRDAALAALKSLDSYLDTETFDAQQENFRFLTLAQRATYRNRVIELSEYAGGIVKRLVDVDGESDKRGR